MLLCVDFSNLIIRHAVSPYGWAVDSQGRSITGPYGSVNQVLRTLREQQPTHLLIAKDCPRDEGFRRDIDADYKAHRPDADDELQRQFALSYAAVHALGWPVVELPTLEADDVIASAAARFTGPTRILTGDKDLLALVSDRVSVDLLRPGHSVLVDPDRVAEFVGVRADQLQDLKALEGDKSDGISGVQGIGHKTAVTLLQRYGSLAAVYKILADADATLDGVGPARVKKLRDGIDHARTSWRLAGMRSDGAVDCDTLALRAHIPNSDAALQLAALDLQAIADLVARG